MDQIKLVRAVIDIAKAAGDVIMDIYAKEADFQIEHKKDESPLTLADRKANAIICAGLEKLPIQYPIISEENKTLPYEVRSTYTYNWLVDPLDGTKEFIKRNGEFTVNIALVHNGSLEMGVVYAPVLEEMFWAVKGAGAFLEKNGKEQALKVAPFKMTDPNLGVVCSRSHLNDATQAFVDQLNEPNLVATGSSLKFLILAKGDAHIYPRLAPTMEWDSGAAQMILEEAGGSVISEASKKPLLYNKENLLNPSFIAYGGKV
ncbi:MAG: 3'(2'),5'-bisphosphate nucleotidase CysQ [Saprospiraceae bacterium]